MKVVKTNVIVDCNTFLDQTDPFFVISSKKQEKKTMKLGSCTYRYGGAEIEAINILKWFLGDSSKSKFFYFGYNKLDRVVIAGAVSRVSLTKTEQVFEAIKDLKKQDRVFKDLKIKKIELYKLGKHGINLIDSKSL